MTQDDHEAVLQSGGLWQRSGPWVVAAIVLVGWVAVWAKVGSGVAFGAPDLMIQIDRFPRVVHFEDSISDYVNYSPLPVALAKLAGATSQRSNAFLQFLILVAGSTEVCVVAARTDRNRAGYGALALFSTIVPLQVFFFNGSYDNVLVVLLFAAALLERPLWVFPVIGLLAGTTHAEIAAVVGVELLALSWCGLGPSIGTRLRLLGGVAVGRVLVTIWALSQHTATSRWSFIRRYGPGKLVHATFSQLPLVLWSLMAGGILMVGYLLVVAPSRRLGVAVAGSLALNVLVVLLTVDETRVAAILTLPLVVVAGAFSPSRPIKRWVCVCAVAITFAPPFYVSYLGSRLKVGHPFQILW